MEYAMNRWILIALISFFCFSYCDIVNCKELGVNYVPFTLLSINIHAKNSNEIFVKIKDVFTKKEINNIVFVLKYYNEDFKVIDNKVFIPVQLANDLDLIANYSKKAFDDEWINTRE
jgi:hypothetical protein